MLGRADYYLLEMVIAFAAASSGARATVKDSHAFSGDVFSAGNISIKYLQSQDCASAIDSRFIGNICNFNSELLRLFTIRLKAINPIYDGAGFKKMPSQKWQSQACFNGCPNTIQDSRTSPMVGEGYVECDTMPFWFVEHSTRPGDDAESFILRVNSGENDSWAFKSKKAFGGPIQKVCEDRQQNRSKASGDDSGNFQSPVFRRFIIYVSGLMIGVAILHIGLEYVYDEWPIFDVGLVDVGILCMICGTALWLATMWRASWG